MSRELKPSSEEKDRPVSISFGGSTHTRKASEWLALARDDLQQALEVEPVKAIKAWAIKSEWEEFNRVGKIVLYEQKQRRFFGEQWEQVTLFISEAPTQSAAQGDSTGLAPSADTSNGEAVAYMWQHEETGGIGFIERWQIENDWQALNPRCKIISPLYKHTQLAIDAWNTRQALEAEPVDHIADASKMIVAWQIYDASEVETLCTVYHKDDAAHYIAKGYKWRALLPAQGGSTGLAEPVVYISEKTYKEILQKQERAKKEGFFSTTTADLYTWQDAFRSHALYLTPAQPPALHQATIEACAKAMYEISPEIDYMHPDSKEYEVKWEDLKDFDHGLYALEIRRAETAIRALGAKHG